MMSFTMDPGNVGKPLSDSLNDKTAFKSLFTNNRFDASKPYAGQLNPRAVAFVQEYVRRQGEHLEKMKSWGKPYFDLYDNILTVYGLPREMKYLSVNRKFTGGQYCIMGRSGSEPLRLDATQDVAEMARRISAIDERDGANFARFIDDNRFKLRHSESILRNPMRSPLDLLGPAVWRDALKVGPVLRPDLSVQTC